MYKMLMVLIFIIGSLIHIYFMGLNEILKIEDSFNYLQMSNYFSALSIEGFGNGWFGFLYSLPISIINYFIDNNLLSAQILNIILFNFSGFLLYKIASKYLTHKYLVLLIILFFLSPILLHFNIAILSENIYLPLFLLIVLGLQNFIEEPRTSDAIAFGFLIALMFFTKGEAFIYLGAIGLVSLFVYFSKKSPLLKREGIKGWVSFNIILIIFFGIFISPYIYYLDNFGGEGKISDKFSSNFNQELITGKSKNISTENYLENQKKLYFHNLPYIIIGDSGKLYSDIESTFFYKNKLFLFILLIPIILLLIGVINLYKNKKRDILLILFSFFFIASIFYTLFSSLDKYFIIFIVLFLIIIVYGIQTIDKVITFSWTGFSKKAINQNKISVHKILQLFLSLIFIGIYSLGLLIYYHSHKLDDKKYQIKKEAGKWLKENGPQSISPKVRELTKLNILEVFPVTTYYSGTNHRFITPYTSSLEKLLIYANFNKIDYLIVDSLDFEKYRPDLEFLLNEKNSFKGLDKIKVFNNTFNGEKQKVIIYKIKNI